MHVDTKKLPSNFEAEIAWIKQPEAEPKNGVAYKRKTWNVPYNSEYKLT